MRIDINQKRISIGDKYQIFIDQQEAYSASSELFKLLSVIDLFKKGYETPNLTIKKQWAWFKPSYEIKLYNGGNFEFAAESLWKMHYLCPCNSDVYHIYGHRGRKYSVYKNDMQVAYWEKQSVTWFEGDNYKILANNDCNVELIIAFCLIIDNYKSKKHKGNSVTFNIGNIGGEVKQFNPDWQPK